MSPIRKGARTQRVQSPSQKLLPVALVLAVLFVLFQATTVSARPPVVQDPYARPSPADPVIDSGVFPTLAAIVPGVLLHGSGHFAGGDTETAIDLLLLEGISVAVTAAGFVPIVATGASRRIITVAYATTLVGLSGFAISWLADVYGSSVGERGGFGTPRLELPPMIAELGYLYVYDPVFDYSHLAHAQIDLRWSALRLTPSTTIAVDDDNQRARLELAYRFVGPKARFEARTDPALEADLDGGFLDLEGATTWHNHGSDGFRVLTVETSLEGRYDMANFGHSLRGSFAEMSLGLGVELYDFDAPGLGFGSDAAPLLLMRFAYGLYLGDPGEAPGELAIYYDHRHDEWPGGLATAGKGDGVPGHFGLGGFYDLTERFGVSASFEAGSAYVASTALRYRL